MSTRITVGTQFHRTTSRPWHDADGTRRVHVRTDLCTVTEADDDGICWDYEGTVSESDRPSFAGSPLSGVASVDGFAASVARGDTVIVSEVSA
jgi:hypothetical protein